MTKVLITGITSKSGEYMLKKMIANTESLQNYSFRFMVRPTSNTELLDAAPLSIEKFYGNLADADSVREFCVGGYDVLVHIAGIDKSLLLVQTAVNYGVSRLVLVHTTGIYSKYKAAGETYRNIEAKIEKITGAGDKNIFLTILRPTMIYGTLQDKNLSVFIRMVDKLRLFPIINGAKYELQPVWCKDLGGAYYDVLMNPEATIGKNYILSGGAPIRLIDMLQEISRQLNVKNTFISCPFCIAFAGAWFLYLISIGKKDYREKIQRLVEPRVFSHEDAAKDFGYHPADFSVGIQNEIEEYKNENMNENMVDKHNV